MKQTCKTEDTQYRKRETMARLYDLNPHTVDAMTKEMAMLDRYPKDFILRDIGYVLIEEAAFRDYLFNRKALKGPGKVYVAPYTRKERLEPVIVLGGTK